MNFRTAILAVSLSFAATACGEEAPAPAPEKKAEAKPEKTAEAKPAPAPAPAPAAAAAGPLTPDAEGVIRLEASDMMKFNADRIEVEGTKVKLELKHTGKMDKQAMGHNFVLLKPGTDPAVWSGKAIAAAATDYVPAGDAEMIAATKLIGGGESDTIEFEVPGPGEYPFLCSFPGHVAMMKGVLVVK